MADTQFFKARIVPLIKKYGNWLDTDVPRAGELVCEFNTPGTDSIQVKVGDGVTKAADLAYLTASSPAQSLSATLAVGNTADNSISLTDTESRRLLLSKDQIAHLVDLTGLGTSFTTYFNLNYVGGKEVLTLLNAAGVEKAYLDGSGNIFAASDGDRDRVGMISQAELTGETFFYIAYNPAGGGGVMKLNADLITGNNVRVLNAPDESGVLVTHTTKDQINVTDGSYTTQVGINFLKTYLAGVFTTMFKDSIVFGMTHISTSVTGVLTRAALSAGRTWVLPNASGTVALTSDIVAQTLQDVTDAGATTTNGIEISSSTYSKTDLNPGAVICARESDSSTVAELIADSTNGGTLFLKDRDSSSDFFLQLNTSPLAADRTQTLPDKDGELAINIKHGQSTQTITGFTMVITHGFGFTPAGVFVTPANVDTGTQIASGYWIDTLTSTQFTVNFISSVPTLSMSFYFQGFKN